MDKTSMTILQAGFQCSSASRKFLNRDNTSDAAEAPYCFSALQRAENSSIYGAIFLLDDAESFSALQRAENSSIATRRSSIPGAALSFSALQRAENSSIQTRFAEMLHQRA